LRPGAAGAAGTVLQGFRIVAIGMNDDADVRQIEPRAATSVPTQTARVRPAQRLQRVRPLVLGEFARRATTGKSALQQRRLQMRTASAMLQNTMAPGDHITAAR